MKNHARITLIRCVVLLGAMGCGVVGYRWYQDRPANLTLDMLDYANGLTHRIDESKAMEARLIAEGQPEETFRAFDIRRNAELEWRDIRSELAKFIGPSSVNQLASHDIYDETELTRADVERVRTRLLSRVPAFTMLGASMVLFVGVLLVRPRRHTGATPEPNFA